MSLRNQPYLPLYVQDFMTDEKLAECSAKSTGVYIRLMCLMHKSEEYGKILLKQKDKQTDNQIENFAGKVAKFFPYDHTTVFNALTELVNECVLDIDGDYLIQKRMVRDAEISEKRAEAGSKGGKKTTGKFAKAKRQAKRQANSEIEIDNKDVLNHSFSKEFSKEWDRWKKYKKVQHNFSYKYIDTEQTALNSLITLSGNNEQTAIAIINQSIASGWKGFVELKATSKSNLQTTSASDYLEQRKKDEERLKAKLA